MSKIESFGKEKMLEYLHILDSLLDEEYRIELCGTAVPLLQDYEFRLTRDIDFARRPDIIVTTAAQRYIQEAGAYRLLFDNQAPGVVCLLEDYEDRLVQIHDDFKHLKVFVLSIEDWIVTKLEAPKFTDMYDYPHFLTHERLQFIEDNMHLYCGLKEDYARESLKLLWEKLKEIENCESFEIPSDTFEAPDNFQN